MATRGWKDGLDIEAGFLQDLAGNESTASASDLTLDYSDIVAPQVLQVLMETPGNYQTGDEVVILVQASEVINISGVDLNDDATRPSLTLDNGATALYSGGAGTDTLRFTYTVGSDNSENTATLNYASTTALSVPNGVLIYDNADNSLITTLPETDSNDALAQTGTGIIDMNAPTITGVTSTTANGAYSTDQVIQIEVSMSEVVTVTGTPTLMTNSGRAATYVSGSGSDTLVFNYTVESGENVGSFDATSLSVNNASIRDAAGNDIATSSLPTGSNANSLQSQSNIELDTDPFSFSFDKVVLVNDYLQIEVSNNFPRKPRRPVGYHL